MGRSAAILEIFLLLGFLLLRLTFAVLLPLVGNAPRAWAAISVIAYVSGLTLFLLAKLSVLRTGTLFSWGSAAMTVPVRICYRAGYAIMFIAIVIGLCLVFLQYAVIYPFSIAAP